METLTAGVMLVVLATVIESAVEALKPMPDLLTAAMRFRGINT